MNTDVRPSIAISGALQSTVECVGALEESVPAQRRPAYLAAVERIRRARTELSLWLDEARG